MSLDPYQEMSKIFSPEAPREWSGDSSLAQDEFEGSRYSPHFFRIQYAPLHPEESDPQTLIWKATNLNRAIDYHRHLKIFPSLLSSKIDY